MPLRPNFIERQVIKMGLVPAPLLDLGLPIFMSTALIGAGEIDLFRKIDERPASLEALAKTTGCKERALHNLLRVLVSLGYVEKQNEKYTLTKYTKKALPIEIFKDIIPFFRDQLLLSLQNVGRALREAPEEGIIGWERVKGGELGRSYQIAMRWLASSTVAEVTKKVNLPDGIMKMIDVGGSHGLYCVEMCRKHPALQATVLDWPIGIENTKETLQLETDVSNRIDTIEADYNQDEITYGYDYAFLGNIVHGNSPEQNQKLFKKLAEATSDNGTIGILDQFGNISGSRFTKSVASLVGWGLFLFANGRAYAIEEVIQWLNEAGFQKTKIKPLKKTPGFTLLIASKQ